MSKNTKTVTDTYGVPNAENPEWAKEKFDRSIGFKDHPASLEAKLSAIQEASRKRRGPQKVRPTKQPVTRTQHGTTLTIHRTMASSVGT